MSETTEITEEPTDVLVALVLDSSGSMGGMREATVEGLNALLADQREQPGKALLSLTVFSSEVNVRYVAEDITEVSNFGTRTNPYVPAGGTALYDAVGATIRGVDKWLLKHRDSFAGRVILVINTDGVENQSREFSLDQINSMITEKVAEGWEVQFLGAGQAAWTESRNFPAIPMDNFASYGANAADTVNTYAVVSSGLVGTRSTGQKYAAGTSAAISSTASETDPTRTQ